jgi:hypothetical protein
MFAASTWREYLSLYAGHIMRFDVCRIVRNTINARGRNLISGCVNLNGRSCHFISFSYRNCFSHLLRSFRMVSEWLMSPFGLGADTPCPEEACTCRGCLSTGNSQNFLLDRWETAELLCGYRVPELQVVRFRQRATVRAVAFGVSGPHRVVSLSL